jgi:hypothetical protein
MLSVMVGSRLHLLNGRNAGHLPGVGGSILRDTYCALGVPGRGALLSVRLHPCFRGDKKCLRNG